MRLKLVRCVFFCGALIAIAAAADSPHFEPWINGVEDSEPALQVQAIDRDTFVIRESFKASANAPFVYLLFGSDEALLIDTGDGEWPIRAAVDRIITDWLAQEHRASISLVVAHSHSHSDHHAGDREFYDRPDTVVVGLHPADVAAFFGIEHWPQDAAAYDLGGRLLDVIPTPGHEAAHIAVYDRRTKTLFSGDSVLPAHVLIPLDEFDTFRASIERLAAFARRNGIETILGGHVEMSAQPRKDFDLGAESHPDERALPLDIDALFELESALRAMEETPRVEMHGSFAIVPLPHEVLAPYELRN